MDNQDFQAGRNVRFVAFLLATLVASLCWPDGSAGSFSFDKQALSATAPAVR
jgi:hypothetical protein